MRLRALLLSAWMGVVPRAALGQSNGGGHALAPCGQPTPASGAWVTVESVPPLASAGTPVPSLGAPPDVSRFEGRRITRVEVVLEGAS
jgi:hypothetical protein